MNAVSPAWVRIPFRGLGSGPAVGLATALTTAWVLVAARFPQGWWAEALLESERYAELREWAAWGLTEAARAPCFWAAISLTFGSMLAHALRPRGLGPARRTVLRSERPETAVETVERSFRRLAGRPRPSGGGRGPGPALLRPPRTGPGHEPGRPRDHHGGGGLPCAPATVRHGGPGRPRGPRPTQRHGRRVRDEPGRDPDLLPGPASLRSRRLPSRPQRPRTGGLPGDPGPGERAHRAVLGLRRCTAWLRRAPSPGRGQRGGQASQSGPTTGPRPDDRAPAPCC